MTSTILVPVDQSEPSTAAVDFAFSEFYDPRITALHVIDSGNLAAVASADEYTTVASEEFREQQETNAEQILMDVEEKANKQNVELETETVVGPPARSIVQYADEHDIDHIVLGSHGRTGTSRVLLGSVAETVARRAPVPVTIAR